MIRPSLAVCSLITFRGSGELFSRHLLSCSVRYRAVSGPARFYDTGGLRPGMSCHAFTGRQHPCS